MKRPKAAVHRKSLRPMLFFLCLLVFVMFLFGFAMVPMYNVLCRALNLNGKIYRAATENNSLIDHSRTVTIQFVTTRNGDIHWKFYPKRFQVTAYPGENKRIDFYAENDEDHDMFIQAIPSITPHEAAPFMVKTQCFCFTRQFMKSHAHRLMPVILHLDPKLPKNIHTVTLSYTLFDITHRVGVKTAASVAAHHLLGLT